jgi:hypothetical protein
MARVVAELPPEERRVPILSSPELAITRAAEVIAADTPPGVPDPNGPRSAAGCGR